jgi:hypothetical protein
MSKLRILSYFHGLYLEYGCDNLSVYSKFTDITNGFSQKVVKILWLNARYYRDRQPGLEGILELATDCKRKKDRGKL